MRRVTAVFLAAFLAAPGPGFAANVGRVKLASLPASVPALPPSFSPPLAIPSAHAAALAAPTASAQLRSLGQEAASNRASPSLGRVFDHSAELAVDPTGPVIEGSQAAHRPLARQAPRAARSGTAGAAALLLLSPSASGSAGIAPWIAVGVAVVIIAILVTFGVWLNRVKSQAASGAINPATMSRDRNRPGPQPTPAGGGAQRQDTAPDADAEAALIAEKPVTFADVAGQDEAKTELERVMRFLKNPERYNKLNPNFKGFKGLLFFGPPGTGKTLMARALAGEAGAAFVTRNGSDFVNTYVGVGPKNVREAFEEIRKKANGGPGILFIDELDALGKKRKEDGNGNAEEEKTVNALLAEMDGFRKDKIIVVGATNRPETLDPALLRGGRFGLKIPVGLPDIHGRLAILKVHSKEMLLSPDVDLAELARRTPGLSGADLEHIIQDATMLAGDRDAPSVTMADLRAGIDRLTIGHERKIAMSDAEKNVVAYHESGHALVSHVLPNADPVRKVTIVPHGLNALGLMQAVSDEERFIQSRAWLLDKMAVALGGRAAEELALGEVFSGAQNDLESATRIARYMVMKFGMSQAAGPVAYDMDGSAPASGRPGSETVRDRIETEVRKLLDEALARARQVLVDHRGTLDTMAAELKEKETLRAEDMARLIPAPK